MNDLRIRRFRTYRHRPSPSCRPRGSFASIADRGVEVTDAIRRRWIRDEAVATHLRGLRLEDEFCESTEEQDEDACRWPASAPARNIDALSSTETPLTAFVPVLDLGLQQRRARQCVGTAFPLRRSSTASTPPATARNMPPQSPSLTVRSMSRLVHPFRTPRV